MEPSQVIIPASPGHPLDTAWILSQRPPRTPVTDPFRPQGFFLEQERSATGRIVQSGCILLTNKECPWRCLMCDLWKHTLSTPTPPGAIPAQIQFALEQFGCRPEQVKLYNSGSFFDSAAIPLSDFPAIARSLSFAENIVVESHPKLIGKRTRQFQDLLETDLEVAMGLETVHPQIFPKLNKRFDLPDFAAAAALLQKSEIGIRAFLLVRPPFMAEAQTVLWTTRSAEFAFGCGASAVSLIPTRAGNGALDALLQTGEFAPPTLALIEEAFASTLALKGGRVFVDLWDLERFSTCDVCFRARQSRLEKMNLTQQFIPQIRCDRCG